MNDSRQQAVQGGLYALTAFAVWGLMPIYWHALGQVPALDIVAHRVIWSALLSLLLVHIAGLWPALLAALRTPRTMAVLLLTTVLVSANWLLFVWTVIEGRLLESSLGYFINPLINVVLGVLVLGERLRRWQTVAVLLAAVGVLQLALRLAVLPWVPLGLALSFAWYGLLRKRAAVDALCGLTIETLLLTPLALAYLLFVSDAPPLFPGDTIGQTLLVMGAGLITTVPLLCFTAAARRLRYTTLGLFQYLAPTGHFLLAVLLYGEPFSAVQATTFALIWLALAVYGWDLQRAGAR